MTDLIFFWLSKVIWLPLSPDLVLILLVFLGVVLLLAGAVKKAKILLSMTVTILLAISFFPLGNFMLAPLENRFPGNPALPVRVDGIICLGGAEDAYLSHLRGQPQMGAAAERLITFIRLMRTYPQAAPLFSGGSGRLTHPEYKDADVARMVLSDLGFDTSAIIFEDNSRNTYENGTASKALVRPEQGQNWVLVTTASHMPRAVGVFRRLNWEVLPYPVDYLTPPDLPFGISLNCSQNLGRFKLALKEWVGLFAYYLTGKTAAWFPGPEKS